MPQHLSKPAEFPACDPTLGVGISAKLMPLAREIQKIPGLNVIFAFESTLLHFKADLNQNGSEGTADVLAAVAQVAENFNYSAGSPRMEVLDDFKRSHQDRIPDALHYFVSLDNKRAQEALTARVRLNRELRQNPPRTSPDPLDVEVASEWLFGR